MPEQELRQIKRVLVGIGTTPESVTAFRQAVQISKRLGAELYAIHVIEPVPPAAAEAMPELVELHEQHERDEFEAFVSNHEITADATTRIEIGAPDEVILHAIKDLGIDLVVFGRYGKGGQKMDRLGSVAHRLIRESPVSVLMVDPADAEPFQRIGVATGFHAESDTIVRRAIHLAKLFGRDSIDVLHAYELPRGYHHAMSEGQACERLERLATRRCEYLQENHADPEGIRLNLLTEQGDVRKVVPRLVAQASVDLLVVGAHSRSTPVMFMLGRTTESIVSASNCAVWATKRPEWYQGIAAVVSKLLGT